jgi:hypothetical protein
MAHSKVHPKGACVKSNGPAKHSDLSICMWNVNGLESKSIGSNKLEDPLFLDTVRNFDIISLVETQLSPNDPLKIEGYSTVRKDRPKSSNGRHYGGWAVLIKEPLRKQGIKIIEQTVDFVWIKVCHGPFKIETDLYICIAYIPPHESSYLKPDFDILEQIQNGIVKYSRIGQVVLTGDLNARTGLELDFVKEDMATNIPQDLQYVMDKQIPPRNSLDQTINSRGREILDLCISSRLRILNGRKIGDTLGYYTCHKWNGSSVVDYALVSEALLDKILYFQVSEYIGTISDHCCIKFKIKTPKFQMSKTEELVLPLPTSYKWDNDALTSYSEALVLPETQADIEQFMKAPYKLREEDVNLATEKLTSIFLKAADKTLKKRSRLATGKSGLKRKKHQPWYNKTLKQQRNSVLSKGKLVAKFPNDPIIRGSFFKHLKLYRKNCKTQQRQHRQLLIENLNNLYSNNPKSYWDMVKQLKETSPDGADKINPSEWQNYFTNLGKCENFQQPHKLTDIKKDVTLLESKPNFTELDFRIEKKEILQAMKNLKNGKTSGPDGLCNEMLKYSTHAMLHVLEKLFNLVLSSGVFPDNWATGYIKPLHKKGDALDPDNYRGITITSVLGKLFNSIINNRITEFTAKHKIIRDEQIGFKAKCRTSDHIFVIRTLTDKYKKDKKPLYMCFVDFRKAFDSISHTCLLYKLLTMNMNGLVYRIIKNMYSKINLQVKVGKGLTGRFTSNVGVRQGDNLSPTLFNLYINDIPNIFDDSCNPVRLSSRALNCLLYADDLVLMSESEAGLQNSLLKLELYCNKWGLTVNAQKTKALIINPTKTSPTELKFAGNSIEWVPHITYLGITIDKKGTTKDCLRHVYNKGLKAIYKLKKVIFPLPNVTTCMHLFNHMIKPVLLYGSEIWTATLFGARNHSLLKLDNIEKLYTSQKTLIEKLQRNYCKTILGVPKNTDNLAPYGELGIHPLYIDAIINMMKYWQHLEKCNENPILRDSYKCTQELHSKGHNTWLSFAMKIKNIIHCTQQTNPLDATKIRLLKNKLRDHYAKHWQEAIGTDSHCKSKNGRKLRTYRTFKSVFGKECYLDVVKNPYWRVSLTKFRLSAHRLLIETGRQAKLDVNQRICRNCPLNKVEDEQHFLLECPLYKQEREKLMCIVTRISPHFTNLTNSDQFSWLMSSQQEDIIIAIAEYVNRAMEHRVAKA